MAAISHFSPFKCTPRQGYGSVQLLICSGLVQVWISWIFFTMRFWLQPQKISSNNYVELCMGGDLVKRKFGIFSIEINKDQTSKTFSKNLLEIPQASKISTLKQESFPKFSKVFLPKLTLMSFQFVLSRLCPVIGLFERPQSLATPTLIASTRMCFSSLKYSFTLIKCVKLGQGLGWKQEIRRSIKVKLPALSGNYDRQTNQQTN